MSVEISDYLMWMVEREDVDMREASDIMLFVKKTQYPREYWFPSYYNGGWALLYLNAWSFWVFSFKSPIW